MPESYFTAGALALAYLLPQSTAEAWSFKCVVMAAVLGTAAAAVSSTRREYGASPAAACWPVLALWLAAGSAWSLYPHRSLVQAVFLALAIMVVFLGRGRPSPGAATICILAIGGAELLLQGWQLGGSLSGEGAEGLPRMFGSFVNANHHAALLSTAYAVSAVGAVCAKWPRNIGFLALAVLFLAGAELSGSRTILASVPATLVLLWKGKPPGFGRTAFMLLAVMSILLLFSPAGPSARLAGQLAGQDQFAWRRADIWMGALRIIRQHPLGGVGLGNFGDAFLSVRPAELARYETDYSHCEPLQFASEAGMVGLGLAIWLATILIVQIPGYFSSDVRRAGLWLAAATIGIFSLTDFPLHVPLLGGITIVCLSAGFPMCGPARKPGRPVPAVARTVIWTASALILAWISVCGAADYFYARGAKLAGAGEIEKAEDALMKALWLRPGHAESLLALAEISAQDRAKRYSTARRLRRAWVPPLNGIFEIAIYEARESDALAALATARKLDPHGLETEIMATKWEIAHGRHSEATSRVVRLEEIWPGHIDVLFLRADLERLKGNSAAARRIISHVLSLYPMNPRARQYLENLP